MWVGLTGSLKNISNMAHKTRYNSGIQGPLPYHQNSEWVRKSKNTRLADVWFYPKGPWNLVIFGSVQNIYEDICSMPKCPWYLVLSKTIWHGSNIPQDILECTKCASRKIKEIFCQENRNKNTEVAIVQHRGYSQYFLIILDKYNLWRFWITILYTWN